MKAKILLINILLTTLLSSCSYWEGVLKEADPTISMSASEIYAKGKEFLDVEDRIGFERGNGTIGQQKNDLGVLAHRFDGVSVEDEFPRLNVLLGECLTSCIVDDAHGTLYVRDDDRPLGVGNLFLLRIEILEQYEAKDC